MQPGVSAFVAERRPPDAAVVLLGGHAFTRAKAALYWPTHLSGDSEAWAASRFTPLNCSFGSYAFWLRAEGMRTLTRAYVASLRASVKREGRGYLRQSVSPDLEFYRLAVRGASTLPRHLNQVYVIEPIPAGHLGGHSHTWNKTRGSITDRYVDHDKLGW